MMLLKSSSTTAVLAWNEVRKFRCRRYCCMVNTYFHHYMYISSNVTSRQTIKIADNKLEEAELCSNLLCCLLSSGGLLYSLYLPLLDLIESIIKIIMLRTLQRSSVTTVGRRAFASEPFLPRITERRLEEGGPGGRSSIAGIKVAIFGATGFLGKHVCNQLGTLLLLVWMVIMMVC